MYEQKYILFKDKNGIETYLIFNKAVEHSTFEKLQVTSAGFIYLNHTDDKWTASCHGESVSLGKRSRPNEDARIIEAQMNMHL